MSCTCVDILGNSLEKCMGTCSTMKRIIEQSNIIQERDPLNGFTEDLMMKVDKHITFRLQSFELTMQSEWIREWKEAYLEGIKEGIKLGRELNNDY